MNLPPPIVFGLPDKFGDWRPAQEASITWALECSQRFILQAAPTGFGKSLAYVVGGMLNGGRVCVLTSTKALQNQLTADFAAVGMRDIRGMNSYVCHIGKEAGLGDIHCNEGPCHLGFTCRLKRDGGCYYYDALRIAANSTLVVTNYSYWMHANRYGEGLGNFDLLVLDEAHDAPDALASFVSVDLDTDELGFVLDDARTPTTYESLVVWAEWAADRAYQCAARTEQWQEDFRRASAGGPPLPPHHVKRTFRAKRLQRKLDMLGSATGTWVIEPDRERKRVMHFSPVWAREYAERFLFCHIPKVIMYSATLRPKTAGLLGIPAHAFSFREYPSDFAVSRRPVVHVPTVSVKYDTSDAELEIWLSRIDQILRQRLDRKGIIHTVSFDRQRLIIQNSEHRRIMLFNSSDNTADAIAKFRRMKGPLVLVSPSVMTGYDFPYDECEYQIITKIPFPDSSSALAKARSKGDADYGIFEAVQMLIQATGRGMRASDDVCETIVVDDNIGWLVRRHRHFFPDWWLEAYRSQMTLPPPPPRLQRT